MKRVSVIGSSSCAEGSEVWGLAEDVGGLLAKAGATVFCGGRGGVMEAVARGVSQAGGRAIGIVPGISAEEANPYCTEVVATAIGQARNLAVVASGDVTIAIGGEWGTLSEIGHARSMGRTVVVLAGWDVSGRGSMADSPGVIAAASPAEAVEAALDAAHD